MPISAGTNIILRSGQDADALAYFSRAGIASGTQTPSSYDNAASFNGTNQFLSTPLTGVNTSQPWSFSCWANVSSSTGYILGKGTDSNGNFGPCISALSFRMSTDGTWGANIREISFGSSFSLNRWTHLAMTWNATDGMRGYVNGVQVGAVAAPTCFNSASDFTIGRYTSFVTAAISSVGAWSKALSASEVTALFNNGAGRTYASLDTGLRTNLVSWWALNQNSVTADSHTTGNNLTNSTNVVTAPNIGPIITGYSDSRRLISDFVRGIKSLGLWNQMVCWPLRASQNAGGGTTAFSLGGLGQFNGTLVNAPVWGANGMIFASASGTRINISNDPIFAPQNTTWGAMCVSSQTSGTRADVFGKTGSVEALADLSWGMRENNTTATLFITDGATFGGFSVSSTGLNLFRSSVMSYDNTLITGRVNGGAASTLSYTPNAQQNTSQVLRIGAGTLASATNFNGPVAFALFGYFSASQQVALHSLYRQTLGLGLGLP
jgi:Concanavalin A-like lectin/glucanases superfamily